MATSGRAPVVVIGGGAIGCAILYGFARRGIAGVLVEAEPDICEGTSKANSAIVHTGFDSKPGTMESRMLRRAAVLWPDLIEALGVPFLEVGALMVARTTEEAGRLASEVGANAAALGVETELLDRAAVRDVAPYLAEDVVAALSIPGESVIDPFWLTRAYAEAAVVAGGELRLGVAVSGLVLGDDGVTVELADGSSIRAEQVVDAAGIRADEVAALAGDASFAITPRKGQFLVSEETFGVDRIVLPIPGPLGKGMLVTPIVFGGLLLGPTAVDGMDKDDRATNPAEADRILASCASMVPEIRQAVAVRQFAGVRHVSSTGDFIVRPSTASDRLYLAAGIRSTGISTSPAVAEAVVDDVMALRGWRAGPVRVLSAPATELPEASGEIVCLCRSIGRGEILAACRTATSPRTLDAIKRRGGAMFGDCQGNLCALDVARIVAAERGIGVVDVEKHRRGSWMWRAGVNRSQSPSTAPGPGPDRLDRTWDVVVVGGGAAGTAAADAIEAGGGSALVVDRSESPTRPTPALHGATVVGLAPDDDGWLVLAQSADETFELRSRAVVLATGGYVEPREQRGIAGPRPAGVITGDLARRILGEGLVPGSRVALVGRGRGGDERAGALATQLRAVGAEVFALDSPPDAVRGDRRVEAVHADGEWLDVDTLILDDRLVPQAFLLRGLGLIDNRPGTRPPADDDGRLPLPGLWAVGCCVVPDIDHARCAEAGAAVGRRVIAELVPA